jgi:uncharacterized membrane protein
MSRRCPVGGVILIALALAGIGVSAYLTVVHYAGVAPVCTTGGVVDCGAVTSSSYSMVPATSIPVSLLGIAWFAVSGGMALMAVIAARHGSAEPASLRIGHVLWAVIGVMVVLYLVYGEIDLRRLCEWCTAVHVLVIASLLVAIGRWQRAPV